MLTDDRFITVEIYTPPTADSAFHLGATGLNVFSDCATGDIEVNISHKVDGRFQHGFALLVSVDASFNSNLRNSDVILISKAKIEKAFTWYENGGFDTINYTFGSKDLLLFNAAIKEHIIDVIRSKKIQTILRPEVFQVDWKERINPEYRSYNGHALIDIDYGDDSYSIQSHDDTTYGSMRFIIKGARSVVFEYSVAYDRTVEIGEYLGGQLVRPKVDEINNLHLEVLKPIAWRDHETNETTSFKIYPFELAAIKERLEKEVYAHHEENAYPQGKHYYLNN